MAKKKRIEKKKKQTKATLTFETKILLSKEDKKLLAKLAKQHGVSQGAVIRLLLRSCSEED